MTERALFPYVLGFGFLLGVAVFIRLFFQNAPYGRYLRAGWGPTIPARLGWVVMETPAVLTVAWFMLSGRNGSAPMTLVFLVFWQIHYLHRAYIFPFRIRETGKRMPVLIAVFAIVFNLYNGYVNGRYLGEFADPYPLSWLFDPRFIVGAIAFFTGFAINLHADHVLIGLRKPLETDYKIPHGGMYRYISCPNYFGELLEWIGWAVLTWSIPGLLFAVWTAANLVPRAYNIHRWYREKFSDHPPDRKAVIPFFL